MVLSIQGGLEIEVVDRGKGCRGARGRGGNREEESWRVLATERRLVVRVRVRERKMGERKASFKDKGPVTPSLPAIWHQCVTSSKAHQGTMQGSKPKHRDPQARVGETIWLPCQPDRLETA